MLRLLARPRWIALSLLVVGLIVMCIELGLWQLRRLDDRREFNAAVTASTTADPIAIEQLPGDEAAEWTTLSGTRLWNSGCWMLEGAFIRDSGERSPYWPGTVLLLDGEGPPRLENALRDVVLEPAV